MMYDDAGSNWGQREQILRPEHQAVSIGIAFTESRLTLAQHFKETPVSFSKPPSLSVTTLSLAGAASQSLGPINHIAIYFDPRPVACDREQLLAQLHSYSLGSSSEPVLRALPPAPAGYNHTDLGPTDIVAKAWQISENAFEITVDLGAPVSRPGVYTVVLFAEVAQHPRTTISLFVP